MLVEVVMPKMGESIQEGKILRWLKKPGEKVEKDETILEISTDKVDSEIPSPAGGILTKIIVPEQETVEVGTVIAMIETDPTAVHVAPVAGREAPATPPTSEAQVSGGVQPPAPLVIAQQRTGTRGRNGERFYSPLVRTIARKEGIALSELEAIRGSGVNGRVTKHDILAYVNARATRPAAASTMSIEARLKPVDEKELAKKYPPPRYTVVRMDNIQQRMAEHMVRSVHTSPHVAAISECDVTRLVEFRSRNAERFERQEGFKLTFTHFFLDAVVRALKEFPLLNSSVEGDTIILKNFIHLGMAVASPMGLIVPVIKNAEEKNFLGIARAINDLATRARNRKLTPDDIQGGTFTVTNYGVFGNIIGTPIINQPQVAILGIGAIKKRPVVLTDEEGRDSVGIRSMVYLTLAFDHRIIDGEMGGKFLEKVVSTVEQYDFTAVF